MYMISTCQYKVAHISLSSKTIAMFFLSAKPPPRHLLIDYMLVDCQNNDVFQSLTIGFVFTYSGKPDKML